MPSSRSPAAPTFFWQGALLLLPVAVFAGLGIILLQRDKAAVRREADESLRNLARQIATFVGDGLTFRIEDQYRWTLQRRERRPPPGTHFSRTENGRHFEIPADLYQQVLDLETNWGTGALNAASWAPRLIVDPDGQMLWPRPYAPAPQPPVTAEPSALADEFARARQLVHQGEGPAALPVLSRIATNTEAVWSEAGIPLQPLASLLALRLRAPNDGAGRHARAEQLASNAVIWPSLLTGAFLDEAVAAWPEPRESGWESGPVWWRQFWGTEEDARELHEHLLAEGRLPLPAKPTVISTHWRGQPWLVLCASTVTRTNSNGRTEPAVGLHFYPEVLVELALQELLSEGEFRIPPYADVSFALADRRLPAITNAVVAEESATWKFKGRGLVGREFGVELTSVPGLTVRLHLTRPDLLFAMQRQRSRWFAGLILGALLTAVAGWLAAYRAFHRQLRLNEMKSNFVSSVSHELRAPIASVRLLAESLERGKIVTPQKQNEYFRFIGQECRRLSSLIENVLDFSRIDQGRKQYEFEPTDMRALVERTVKLMESYAAEKEVTLETSNSEHPTANVQHPTANSQQAISNVQHPTANIELNVDGRALQQALVNLIDNAIKHSPKGGVVRVGMVAVGSPESGVRSPESGRAGEGDSRFTPHVSRLHLFVQDHGEGIPREEHEKIFERFYRLGSELRRETQGVGIGLSIVKHIVEAHAGRVLVESEPGRGSRFTIELPGPVGKLNE